LRVTGSSSTSIAAAAAAAGEAGLLMMSEKRCELSTAELKQFDGTGPSGKLYVAVNGKIFDVTDKGSHFYSKGVCVRPALQHSPSLCCNVCTHSYVR